MNLDAFYGSAPISLWKQIIGEELQYHFGYFRGQEDLATALRQTVRNFFPHITEGATILDAGCGWGGPAGVLAHERGCTVHCVTVSSPQAAYCAELGLSVDVCDLEEEVALTGAYDVAFLLESLEHIRDKAALLRRLRARAARLVLSTACVADHYPGPRLTFGGSIVFCSVTELRRMLVDAGWEITAMSNRRPHAAPTLFHWKDRFDRVFGRETPPGQLAVLRELTEAALRDLAGWSRAFPLIDVVAC